MAMLAAEQKAAKIWSGFFVWESWEENSPSDGPSSPGTEVQNKCQELSGFIEYLGLETVVSLMAAGGVRASYIWL